MTHLPADIQNYMRKLAELDPPIYLTGENCRTLLYVIGLNALI